MPMLRQTLLCRHSYSLFVPIRCGLAPTDGGGSHVEFEPADLSGRSNQVCEWSNAPAHDNRSAVDEGSLGKRPEELVWSQRRRQFFGGGTFDRAAIFFVCLSMLSPSAPGRALFRMPRSVTRSTEPAPFGHGTVSAHAGDDPSQKMKEAAYALRATPPPVCRARSRAWHPLTQLTPPQAA